MALLALATSLFFGWLTWLTGGSQSPLFHWILAMPLVIAVVVQDFPRATLLAAVATLASGITLLLLDHRGGALATEWTVQALGMCGLAYYASVIYRRLREREKRLVQDRLEALTRARQLDAEVSARERAEDALRIRDDFLAVAAHELKTPLTSLSLQVENLVGSSGRPQPPAALTQKVERVDRSLRRLRSLVEDLLDVSRLSTPRLPLELELVDFTGLCAAAAERLETQATHAGSKLQLTLQPQVVGLWDRKLLDQVVTNLLSNAIKYGRGQPIRVALVVDGVLEVAYLTVADQGIGVEAKDQERIFQRFERAASFAHYGGLGIGLWLVRRVAEALGGEVSVESEPGRGSTFTVRLPLRRDGP